MMSDGVKNKEKDSLAVLDIAEMIATAKDLNVSSLLLS